MPARFEMFFLTLSKDPCLSSKKAFVEGDPFQYQIQITNDGTDSFPPMDMVVTGQWGFPDQRSHLVRMALSKGFLAPGQFARSEAMTVSVMSPGFALFTLDYRPYGQGCVLHDSGGRDINPLDGKALASFRGVSIMELRTVTGLMLAATAAAISAVGLVLSIVLR